MNTDNRYAQKHLNCALTALEQYLTLLEDNDAPMRVRLPYDDARLYIRSLLNRVNDTINGRFEAGEDAVQADERRAGA